jgi:carbon storage regulator
MLILTRRTGESVIINGDIKIKILKNENGQVRLGFEAPDDVVIMRKELLEKENITGGGT